MPRLTLYALFASPDAHEPLGYVHLDDDGRGWCAALPSRDDPMTPGSVVAGPMRKASHAERALHRYHGRTATA